MLVLITGGGTGIGRACAIEFAKEGADLVLLCNKSVVGANDAAEKARSLGVKAEVFSLDLRDEAAINRTAAAIIANIGTPDVIVNNAGVWKGGVLQDMDANVINAIFDVNIKGMMYLTKAFADAMIEKRKGSIINISSMWGQSGASCESVYSASKGAVDAFTKSMAKELGPSGIRVNAISPGVILTDMCAGYPQEVLDDLASQSALLRNGLPEDIANVATFLASDKAAFITGQIIGVNGGIQI